MKYKAVLFDLDGTLIDSLEDIANSMNTVLTRFGYPTHHIQSYKYFVGDGMENLVLRSLPETHKSEEIVSLCFNAVKEEYGKHWADNLHAYDGITQLLDELQMRNLKLTILSNKPNDLTKIVVTKFLSNWNFEEVFGAHPNMPKKPNPMAAKLIAKKIDILPGEFIYLGDTDTDMETANAAGMYAVGALWGFRTAEELISSGAQTLIKYPLDLLKLL